MFFMPSVFGNLIVNGGFENSAPVCTQNGGGWCLFDNPSLIAPWRFSGQPLYELDYTVWPASDAASGKFILSACVELLPPSFLHGKY